MRIEVEIGAAFFERNRVYRCGAADFMSRPKLCRWPSIRSRGECPILFVGDFSGLTSSCWIAWHDHEFLDVADSCSKSRNRSAGPCCSGFTNTSRLGQAHGGRWARTTNSDEMVCFGRQRVNEGQKKTCNQKREPKMDADSRIVKRKEESTHLDNGFVGKDRGENAEDLGTVVILFAAMRT